MKDFREVHNLDQGKEGWTGCGFSPKGKLFVIEEKPPAKEINGLEFDHIKTNTDICAAVLKVYAQQHVVVENDRGVEGWFPKGIGEMIKAMPPGAITRVTKPLDFGAVGKKVNDFTDDTDAYVYATEPKAPPAPRKEHYGVGCSDLNQAECKRHFQDAYNAWMERNL